MGNSKFPVAVGLYIYEGLKFALFALQLKVGLHYKTCMITDTGLLNNQHIRFIRLYKYL